MSKDKPKPTISTRAGAPGSPANSSEAFRQAEVQLALGDEDRDERALEALDAMEAGAAGAEPDDADAVTRRLVHGHEHTDEDVDPEAEEDLNEALEDKVRESRAEATKEKINTVYNLTPHGLP